MKGQPRPLVPGHVPGRAPAELGPWSTAEDVTAHNVGDRGTIPVTDEWLLTQGVEPPRGGQKWVYATIEQQSHGARRHWLRVVPASTDGPEWPVVQPARPVTVRHAAPRGRRVHAGRVTVILPDPQIGFRRYNDGTVEPMHDKAAMAVALALIEFIRPHRIVNLGDYLDLAEWSSKFAVLPEFVDTTQASVDEGHLFLAEQQAAAGDTLEEHELVEGNHDDRIPRLISQNAKSAMRLRRADEPKGWPVMSVPNLLALDSLPVPVRYVDGYPAGRLKLASAHGAQAPLYALHGERTDMAKQARSERQSTVQGHAHHLSMHSETYEVDGEPVEVESWSLGCLCRVDGVVPSTRGGTGVRGRPVLRHESWQQAVGVLTETDDAWALEPVRIRDGRAVYRGMTFGAEAA